MELENHQIAALFLASPAVIFYLVAVFISIKGTVKANKESKRESVMKMLFIVTSPLVAAGLAYIELGFWDTVLALVFSGTLYISITFSQVGLNKENSEMK